MTCVSSGPQNSVYCQFKTENPEKPTEVQILVDGESIKSKSFDTYPAQSQTTAILFLVDISDPSRSQTVASNVVAIGKIVDQLAPHQKVGLAVFDSDIKVLAPMGSSAEAMRIALSKIKAGGAATEFYKNIIAGAKLLQTYTADRKAMVLLSDGKAEDRAYGHADAINALRSGGITIIGLGFTETRSDVPYLQTIERLSKETGGAFFPATQARLLPEPFYSAPFRSVETGGHFTFDVSRFFGTVHVQANIVSQNRQLQSFSADVDVNNGRPIGQTVLAFISSYWIFLVVGLLAFFMLVVVTRSRRRRSKDLHMTIEYGFLEALDGQGTTYPLNRSAIRIGRSEESDIQLVNGSVSRNHAELHRRDDGWYIVDLASTNGIRLNEEAVTNAHLKTSDIVEIGEVRFRFVEF